MALDRQMLSKSLPTPYCLMLFNCFVVIHLPT